jgi:hypothetical protein
MFGKNKSKLKLTGRAGLIYKKDGRTMLVDSEMLNEPTRQPTAEAVPIGKI